MIKDWIIQENDLLTSNNTVYILHCITEKEKRSLRLTFKSMYNVTTVTLSIYAETSLYKYIIRYNYIHVSVILKTIQNINTYSNEPL